MVGSGGDWLVLGAPGCGGHLRCVLGVAEGQQVGVLGHVECCGAVERHELAVNDGESTLGTVIVGVLDHSFKDRAEVKRIRRCR